MSYEKAMKHSRNVRKLKKQANMYMGFDAFTQPTPSVWAHPYLGPLKNIKWWWSDRHDPHTRECIREQIAEAKVAKEEMKRQANFRKWFGDSKVVDAKGKPLVVYHGTSEDFSVLRPSTQGTFGPGIYMGNTQEAAEAYGDSVIALYASIRNPWKVSAEFDTSLAAEFDWENPALDELDALPEGRIIIEETIADRGLAEFGHFGEDLKRYLTRLEYDGVVATYPDGSQEIVAFRPEQIKSATGNNGDFDPTNPDITK